MNLGLKKVKPGLKNEVPETEFRRYRHEVCDGGNFT
jgi:hypothetical protein